MIEPKFLELDEPLLKIMADKTGVLEERLWGTESFYIEGAAASGKTMLMRILLHKHPEVPYVWFDLSREKESDVLQEISLLGPKRKTWIILDRFECCKEQNLTDCIVQIIEYGSNEYCFFIISRENLSKTSTFSFGFRLDGVHDVDIGLYGLVAVMTGSFPQI